MCVLTEFGIAPEILGGELGSEWCVRLLVQVRYQMRHIFLSKYIINTIEISQKTLKTFIQFILMIQH